MRAQMVLLAAQGLRNDEIATRLNCRREVASPTGLGDYVAVLASLCNTISAVEIHDSAHKHGVADEDIHHAIDHALAIEDAGEDPDRWLLMDPTPLATSSRSS